MYTHSHTVGELALEEELFAKLLYLFRSPKAMIEVTRRRDIGTVLEAHSTEHQHDYYDVHSSESDEAGDDPVTSRLSSLRRRKRHAYVQR